jgi:hypothetical protein
MEGFLLARCHNVAVGIPVNLDWIAYDIRVWRWLMRGIAVQDPLWHDIELKLFILSNKGTAWTPLNTYLQLNNKFQIHYNLAVDHLSLCHIIIFLRLIKLFGAIHWNLRTLKIIYRRAWMYIWADELLTDCRFDSPMDWTCRLCLSVNHSYKIPLNSNRWTFDEYEQI